jgi:hypothetical protein
MRTDRYNDIKDYISTGDCVVFGGKGFVSDTIKLFTLSPYSHIGMTVWLNFPNEDVPTLYLAESTTLSNVQDITGEFRDGFQITLMDERITKFEGKAWLLKLHEPLASHEAEVLKDFILECHAKRLKYDTEQAIEAGLDCGPVEWLQRKLGVKRTSDLTKVFCSEVTGAGLIKVNRLSKDTDVSELTPADVVHLPCFEQPYEL